MRQGAHGPENIKPSGTPPAAADAPYTAVQPESANSPAVKGSVTAALAIVPRTQTVSAPVLVRTPLPTANARVSDAQALPRAVAKLAPADTAVQVASLPPASTTIILPLASDALSFDAGDNGSAPLPMLPGSCPFTMYFVSGP